MFKINRRRTSRAREYIIVRTVDAMILILLSGRVAVDFRRRLAQLYLRLYECDCALGDQLNYTNRQRTRHERGMACKKCDNRNGADSLGSNSFYDKHILDWFT